MKARGELLSFKAPNFKFRSYRLWPCSDNRNKQEFSFLLKLLHFLLKELCHQTKSHKDMLLFSKM